MTFSQVLPGKQMPSFVCPGLVGDEEVVFTSDSLSGKTTLLFFYSKDFGGDLLTIHPKSIQPKNMFKPRARHAWM